MDSGDFSDNAPQVRLGANVIPFAIKEYHTRRSDQFLQRPPPRKPSCIIEDIVRQAADHEKFLRCSPISKRSRPQPSGTIGT